jgi:hypothetical protein
MVGSLQRSRSRRHDHQHCGHPTSRRADCRNSDPVDPENSELRGGNLPDTDRRLGLVASLYPLIVQATAAGRTKFRAARNDGNNPISDASTNEVTIQKSAPMGHRTE